MLDYTCLLQNCRLQTGDWRLETRKCHVIFVFCRTVDCKLETRISLLDCTCHLQNCRLQTGDWRLVYVRLYLSSVELETVDWRLETGDWRLVYVRLYLSSVELQAVDWRLETGDSYMSDYTCLLQNCRLQTGDWRLETRLCQIILVFCRTVDCRLDTRISLLDCTCHLQNCRLETGDLYMLDYMCLLQHCRLQTGDCRLAYVRQTILIFVIKENFLCTVGTVQNDHISLFIKIHIFLFRTFCIYFFKKKLFWLRTGTPPPHPLFMDPSVTFIFFGFFNLRTAVFYKQKRRRGRILCAKLQSCKKLFNKSI